MFEAQVVVGGIVGEEHAIIEGILAAQVVAKHNVREFVREHSREAGLVGKHVDQSPADDDGVADTESFERRREQHAGAHRTRQVDVVGHLEVVDHSLKNVIHIALGRNQARAREAFDNVIFRLLLPDALGLQWRSILSGGAFVLDAVHANLREFVVLASLLQVVAPDAGLRFESDLVFHACAEVAFFAVNVSRHPVAGNQVEAPAIHVEEVGIARGRIISAVEPDNVIFLIFNPEAAEEAPSAGVLLGCDVEHQAAHVAEKFAANVVKLVV